MPLEIRQMKNISKLKTTALLAFILCSITCHAQTLNGTFQGEIEGISPIIVHLKASEGVVEGFYKYPADSTVIFLTGTLDDAGHLSLTGTQKPYPALNGTLSGKVIEGSIAMSRRATPQPFYAVDFRGEYCDQHHSDYLRIFLSESGYTLRGLNYSDKQEPITTFRRENGQIGFRADSLNTTMYLLGDTLALDTLRGMPKFMPHTPWRSYDRGGLSFTISEEFWSSESFGEFPEKDDDFSPDGRLSKLNDTISLRFTQIPQSEYIVSRWTAPRERTYKVIKDFAKINKLLGKKLKKIEICDPESGEPLYHGTELTYNDGTKRVLDWLYDFESYPDAFIAYYPELEILIVESEAGGDEIIDFNDSASRYDIGNPGQTATSPDGRWRVTGYYPGGACDTNEWWLERWNPALNKYERCSNYDEHQAEGHYSLRYVDGWFWADDRTVLFKTEFTDAIYFKLEIEETNNTQGQISRKTAPE